MSIEAMKQALEALEDRHLETDGDIQAAAITTLRAAIEAYVPEVGFGNMAEQEPVAWMTINAYGEEDDIHYENPEGHLPEGWTYKPLYTTPQPAQPEPEPLEYWNAVEGWVKIDEVRQHFASVGCGTIYKTAGEDRVPVYSTPPAAQHQPLTKEKLEAMAEQHVTNCYFDTLTFARAIEVAHGITGEKK